MKNLKTTIAIFAVAITLFSCNKKAETPAAVATTEEQESTSTFSCKINGVSWVAKTASGGDNAALKLTAINATAADGNTMIFTLKEAIAKQGTVALDGTNGRLLITVKTKIIVSPTRVALLLKLLPAPAPKELSVLL